MENQQNITDKFVNWIVSFIYSREKRYYRILALLVLIGFILRVIAALNLDVFADDMVYAEQSANIWHANILSTNSHPPLFYYLTDIAFKIFGYTTFASRFTSIVAGTLLIIVVFLITRKLWNEQAAICAAFFATFANFLIKLTVSEQSLMVFFFSFFAIYVGMIYLESKRIKYLIFAAVLFGLANLSKYNGFFFLTGFVLFAIYYIHHKKDKILSKQNIKQGIIAFLIIILLALPFLAFNYFIYKQSGFLDFQFTKILKAPKALQLFQGLGGIDTGLVEGLTKISSYSNYDLIYRTDLILLIFMLIGLFLIIYKKEKTPLAFFICFLLIPFVLQSASSTLTKHFVFIQIVATIIAGYALYNVLLFTSKQISTKRYLKIAMILVLVCLLIFNLGNYNGSASSYLKPSAASQLKSYINENVQPNDLLVLDSRIYTGHAFWLATDNNFLNIQQFVEFYNYNNNLQPQQKTQVNVYFVECAIDNCGWGSVSSINESSEQIFSQISNFSTVSSSIYAPIYSGNEIFGKKDKEERYKIYKAQFSLSPQLVQSTKTMSSFYYAPYLYLNMKDFPFNYQASGPSALLDWLAHVSLYLSVLLAIISLFILFFFL